MIRRRQAMAAMAGAGAAAAGLAQGSEDGFMRVTTLRCAAAGARMLSPVGIPFRFGAFPAAWRDRLCARYPAGPGGTLIAVQAEQFRIRGDGTLIHCAGHLRLPASYAAGAAVEIGFAPPQIAARLAPPVPDWAALWDRGVDFAIELSIWEPQVHWLAFDRQPATGDEVEVTIADGLGSRIYRRRFVAEHSWKTAHDHGRALFDHLAKAITQDPEGRHRCYEPRSLPRREGRAGEINDDHFRPKYGNSLVVNDLGLAFGFATEAGRDGPRRSLARARGPDRWNESEGRHGLYVWSRWQPGDPGPSTIRVRIRRAPGSSLSFFADRDGTKAVDAVLEPVNEPVPRRLWRARFDAGRPSPDSPWFDGALLRQEERRAAFVDVDGVVHPHLEAWFRVSRDRDGRIVDRQATIENARCFAAARDHIYDARILVDGVVRSDAAPRRWRDLHHGPWETWRWAEDRPAASCDAADFMRARLVFPWTRFPAEDHTPEMACKLRGADIDHERNETAALRWRDGRRAEDWTGLRRPVRETLNDPLYAGAWCFTGEGGARAELGVFSSWEWWFWTGDTLATWPSLEAQADNVFGARGFQLRDELAEGADALATPNLYLRWDVAPHAGTTTRLGNPFGRPQQPDPRFHPTGQAYLLKRPFLPANSHLPSSGIYSAYLVRPEKCFFDKQEQYAWYGLLKTQSDNLLTMPRAGGRPGDPDHVIGYQVANGERSYAWPMREVLRAAFLHFEGHRRRAYWRRVAQDQANHFNLLCARTIWGAFHVRNLFNPDSNSWRDVPPILPGGRLRGPTPGHVQAMSRLDAFKSGYVNMCAMHGMDLDAADFSPGIQRCLWQLRALEDAPPEAWFRLLGTPGDAMALCSDLVVRPGPGGAPQLSSASGDWPVWPHDDMRGLHAWLAGAIRDPALARSLRIPRGLAELDADLGEVGYSFVKQHQAGLHMLARYHRDARIRDRARFWIARIDAQWPGTARIATGGDPARPRAKLFQQVDLIPEERIA
jgi:hypothetical protein